jgi:chromosome segregation ATPase
MPVEEVRTLATSYQLASLDENQISVFVKQGSITPEMEKALAKITAQKADVARLEEDMETRQKDIERIVEDQGRLRENMKALKGTAEEKALVQRYTRQLDEQETQLESLRKNIQATEAQRDKANAQLENMIQDLQIEASI